MPELVKDGESIGDKKIGPKGKGGVFQKYKWWIVGGLAVVAALVYYFYKKNQAAQQQQGNQQPGIDPATGLPYASEYGTSGFFGGGGPGGTGPRGPRGPRGPGGPGDGVGKVHVPSVIGLNRAESAAKLSAAGLVYHQANVVHGTAKAVSESPTAGTKVNLGSTVTVTMQEVGGHHHGDGAGGNATPAKPVGGRRSGGPIATLMAADTGVSSNKPGIGGLLPKVPNLVG